MSKIASFLSSFCVASIFIGSLYMLCPSGAMSKPIKYVLSLVFLITVISVGGITVKNADIDFDFTAKAEGSDRLQIKNAEYVYSHALRSADIEFSEIQIFTDKTENGDISINKVIVFTACERERVLEALGSAAKNIEVEIINE